MNRSKDRRMLLPSIATSSMPGTKARWRIWSAPLWRATRDNVEGVVRGNPVGQFQERPEPGQLGASVSGHRTPVIAAAQHTEQGDGDDVEKLVANVVVSGIGHRFKGAENPRGCLG